MQKPQPNLLLSQFDKVYELPDMHRSLCDHWLQVCPLNTPLDESIKLMNDVIKRLYGLLHEPEMKIDQVFPSRTSCGELA